MKKFTSLLLAGLLFSQGSFAAIQHGNQTIKGSLAVGGSQTFTGPTSATQMNVDNIRVDGNTLSTLNTNGDFTIDLNGTGSTIFADLTATTVPYLDASKKLKSSTATDTHLGYLANATSNICGISQVCTETNKTFTSPAINGANLNFGTATNSNRILLPTETTTNFNLLTGTAGLLGYDSSKAKPVYHDGIAWREIGSGAASGGGSKNYLGTVNGVNGNGDLELAATTKWSLGTTGTLTNGLPTGTPSFGSGASGNLSIAVATLGNQIAGANSLTYASSAATTAGNMVASDAFTIDVSDQAKMMGVKIYYKASLNPGNANWSGTSSNSFAWAIYDVTNSAWIIPTGAFGFTQSSGVGIVSGNFQTSASGTQYRIVVYNANATSGAVTVVLDDFTLGPQTYSIGVPVTDPQASTCTSTWTTNTTTTCKVARIGGEAEIEWTATLSGAPNAAQLIFNLPSGLVIDSSRLSFTPTGSYFLNGTGSGYGSGSAYKFHTFWNSTTNIVPLYQNTTAGAATAINATAPITWASGNTITAKVKVPIVGWSSNVQMSNDTDTRVVAFAGSSSGQTIANGGVDRQLNIGTVTTDTHGGVNGNTYVVPVSGTYLFDLGVSLNATTTGLLVAKYSVNGGTAVSLGAFTNLPQYTRIGSPRLIEFKAGDVIRFYLNNGTSTASPLVDLQTFYLARLSGPTSIAATESVSARYTSTATTAITSTPAAITYATKDYDSHASYSGSTYTVPVMGKYQFVASFAVGGALVTTATVAIYKNGSSVASQSVIRLNTASGTLNPQVVTTLNLLPGDTIQVYASLSGGSENMSGSANQNRFEVLRVAN